ncbi:MAG: SDR family oxidoreductase, partial [Steroidobacteraceae bacterium]
MIAANTQTEGDMILVTGASGTVGTALVAVLKAGGHRFRAAYHAADKAAAAAQDGYDAVTIDLTKPDTLPPALVGVDAVFLLGTGVRRQAEGEKNMLDAAGAAGIRLLVKQSIWRAAEEEYALAHMHRSVEEAIEASGLAWTFLRPNGFMQNLSGPMAAAIKATGAIYQPAADARISFIDARDIAAA